MPNEYIDQIQVSTTTYDIITKKRSYYVKGTHASGSAWTGALSEVDSLYEGLVIDYWLPAVGSGNATLNLTLKDGSETGAINVYRSGTSRQTNNPPANSLLRLVYQTVTISGTEYTGWWADQSYYVNDQAMNLYNGTAPYKAASTFYRYQLLFQTDADTLTPLTSANNDTDTSKTMLTNVEFDPWGRIFYFQSTGSVSSGGNITTAAYYAFNGIDVRYSLNCGQTLTAGKDLYLKVVPQSNGMVKLATDPCWAQDLPASDDSCWYVRLGRVSGTNNLTLHPIHPVFGWSNGAWREIGDPKKVYPSSSSGGGTWGSITGTLSNQTDLQNALNNKANSIDIYTTTEIDSFVTSISTSLSTYVNKTGDNMIGPLNINYINTNINGSNPANNIYGEELGFKDNQRYKFARIQTAHYDNGEAALQLGIKRTINNSETNNVLEVKLGANGERTYYVHEPSAFRSAIELTDIAIRPNYEISTVDLTDGTSALAVGKLYFVYEA